jgi:SAM-dependent methyltransferase
MLDTAAPALARAWDYLLGGGASFAADRSLAQQLESVHPGLRETLAASRGYVAAQVTRIARSGVDQYLDLGAGLPTRPATHQAARAVRPGARVAYVDRDPAVIEHGTVLVPAGVRYVRGDLAEPEAILHSADLAGFLDFTRPVCLVASLALHVLDPGTARGVAAVLLRSVAPGSCLVVTMAPARSGGLPGSVWPDAATPADLAAFCSGLDLLPPGVHEGPVLGAAAVKPQPAPSRLA